MGETCEHCGFSIPLEAERCPHCGLPGLFPNVRAAEQQEELDGLDARYKTVIGECAKRGCEKQVREFERTAGKSQAVYNRSISVLKRLASSERELDATFYDLEDSGLRYSKDDKWNRMRRPTDDMLFPGYRGPIHDALLSLDGCGMFYYGDCSAEFREDMIAHRASVFEENSVLFMKKHDIKIWDAANLPKGYRAAWGSRAKLCVAKLGGQITGGMTYDGFCGLLCREEGDPEKDDFVEVHIFGPITIRTLGRIKIKRPGRKRQRIILKAWKESLVKAGVDVEIV